MDWLKTAIGKKIIALVVGAVVQVVGARVGLTDEQMVSITAMIVAYIIGQGIADAGKGKVQEQEKINAKNGVSIPLGGK